jgi:hypothetical protein
MFHQDRDGGFNVSNVQCVSIMHVMHNACQFRTMRVSFAQCVSVLHNACQFRTMCFSFAQLVLHNACQFSTMRVSFAQCVSVLHNVCLSDAHIAQCESQVCVPITDLCTHFNAMHVKGDRTSACQSVLQQCVSQVDDALECNGPSCSGFKWFRQRAQGSSMCYSLINMPCTRCLGDEEGSGKIGYALQHTILDT